MTKRFKVSYTIDIEGVSTHIVQILNVNSSHEALMHVLRKTSKDGVHPSVHFVKVERY